jgi:translation initiation factor 4G
VDDIFDLKDSLDLVEGHHPIFLQVLQQINQLKGENHVSELLSEFKINLKTTIPESERSKETMARVLQEYGLGFLYPLLQIESELVKLVAASDSTPKSIYSWIKENVDAHLQTTPGFINVLFFTLAKQIVEQAKEEISKSAEDNGSPSAVANLEKEMLGKYAAMLNAFLNDKGELQLTVLYTLQSLCHELGFPKGMILRWFIALYELEIVEEDVLLQWKEDINDEYEGKGQALFQLNTWLTWLAETEETDDEDDESDDAIPKQ